MSKSNTTNPLKEPHPNESDYREMIYQRNVQNPYSEESQSETAYNKGFEECWCHFFGKTPSKESNTDCSVEQAAGEFAEKYLVLKPEEDYYKDDVEESYYDYSSRIFLNQVSVRNAFIAGAKWSSQLKPVDCSVDGSEAVLDVLNQCREYFDGKADADFSGESYRPNKEMCILAGIDHILERYFTPPNTEQL